MLKTGYLFLITHVRETILGGAHRKIKLSRGYVVMV